MPAIQPSPIPNFLYGTAWKEDRTPALIELALRTGFRGIDTANQRRHYCEAGVGQALAAAYRAGVVTRAELFLQTKFTYQGGQDHRLPYDPTADLSTQVAQSMASSLEHLGTEYVDSYVLHGPSSARHWTDDDAEVWTAGGPHRRPRAGAAARVRVPTRARCRPAPAARPRPRGAHAAGPGEPRPRALRRRGASDRVAVRLAGAFRP